MNEPTLCLCMMVKNEAHVIQRALDSIRPYIDYWVICDTGSTDETISLVRETMKEIDGELHHTEWINFGHNRTELLRLAKGKADYILIMDADMTVNVKAAFKNFLQHDSYMIRYEGDVDYCQPMLISNQHDWEFTGVTHEYIQSATATTWDFFPSLTLTHYGDGGCRSDKLERDVRLLTEALATDPDNARNQFYLAQSYKDLGKWDNALYWFQRRIDQGGWEEETWYATYQLARMKEKAGHPWPETLAAYQLALDSRPERLEPLYAIVKHYTDEEQYMMGYTYSSIALQGLAYPTYDTLFIDKPVYDYLLLLKHIECALACGRISEAIKGANIILQQKELPVAAYLQAVHIRTVAYRFISGKRNPFPAPVSKLVVIIPFYNAGVWLNECVKSLLSQTYQQAEYIFIDDASDDEHKDFIPPVSLTSKLIRNKKRMGAVYNIYQSILEYCDPDDVVVCVDGDDRLANNLALQTIADRYQEYGCWVMYGQYQGSDGTKGVSAPFASPDDFKTLRDRWRTSHIKTFRAGLFMKIGEQDPSYDCLKDESGSWLRSATDAAIMYPLLEMAGFYRSLFNEDILYIYNRENEKSHHHEDKKEQTRNFDRLQKMRPFAPVEQYVPVELLKESI